jgi:hypothetical protein
MPRSDGNLAAERLPDGQVAPLVRAAIDASTELKAPDALRRRIFVVDVGLGLTAALLGALGRAAADPISAAASATAARCALRGVAASA